MLRKEEWTGKRIEENKLTKYTEEEGWREREKNEKRIGKQKSRMEERKGKGNKWKAEKIKKEIKKRN